MCSPDVASFNSYSENLSDDMQIFKKLYFLNWRIVALQNFVFCQTSTWISHRTCKFSNCIKDKVIIIFIGTHILDCVFKVMCFTQLLWMSGHHSVQYVYMYWYGEIPMLLCYSSQNRLHVCMLLSHFWETTLSRCTSCIWRKTPKAQLYPHCQGSPSRSCPAVLPSGLVTDTLDLSGKALWGVWGRCLTYSSFLLFSFLGRERGGSGGNKSDLERLKPSFSPWMTWTLPFVVNITSFIDAAPMALRFNCWVTVYKIANQTEVFLLLILSLKLFVHLVQHHPHFMWPARPESNSRVFGLPTPGIEVLVA